MELRLMSTREEKELYARKLEEARVTRCAGFREKEHSVIGEMHLAFGDLYSLFETSEDGDLGEMVAGFLIHSLDRLPQSYPVPDLRHLEQRLVFEAGEMWSLSPGAGMVARLASAIVFAVREAQLVLVYPIARPWDGTRPYAAFAAVGEPVSWPFAETLEGQPVYVQPMVLTGKRLENLKSFAMGLKIEVSDGGSRIRLPANVREIAMLAVASHTRDKAARGASADQTGASL